MHQSKQALSSITTLLIILSVLSLTLSGYILFKSFQQTPRVTAPIETTPTPTPAGDTTKIQQCKEKSQCSPAIGALTCANPASVFCECMGGMALTKSQIPGGDVAECSLNGETRDAWEYFRSMTGAADQTTSYTCPDNGWVDCMPGTDPKPECSTEAMTWYENNCPNFKGGAL